MILSAFRAENIRIRRIPFVLLYLLQWDRMHCFMCISAFFLACYPIKVSPRIKGTPEQRPLHAPCLIGQGTLPSATFLRGKPCQGREALGKRNRNNGYSKKHIERRNKMPTYYTCSFSPQTGMMLVIESLI